MPKQLSDYQSALIITTLGDGSLVVSLHQGNAHKFGPKGQEVLANHVKSLADALAPLYKGFTAT